MKVPPPRPNLPVIEKLKSAYKLWIPIRRNLPRTEQFGIGSKIDSLFLETLETLRTASFSKLSEKITLLDSAMLKTDSLRFFIQLTWESKLVTNAQFSLLGLPIEETGRMIGGWKKGYITKTSAKKAEENKE